MSWRAGTAASAWLPRPPRSRWRWGATVTGHNQAMTPWRCQSCISGLHAAVFVQAAGPLPDPGGTLERSWSLSATNTAFSAMRGARITRAHLKCVEARVELVFALCFQRLAAVRSAVLQCSRTSNPARLKAASSGSRGWECAGLQTWLHGTGTGRYLCSMRLPSKFVTRVNVWCRTVQTIQFDCDLRALSI